jgi:hypothetical protein
MHAKRSGLDVVSGKFPQIILGRADGNFMADAAGSHSNGV